jgi:hypothetical protein
LAFLSVTINEYDVICNGHVSGSAFWQCSTSAASKGWGGGTLKTSVATKHKMWIA